MRAKEEYVYRLAADFMAVRGKDNERRINKNKKERTEIIRNWIKLKGDEKMNLNNNSVANSKRMIILLVILFLGIFLKFASADERIWVRVEPTVPYINSLCFYGGAMPMTFYMKLYDADGNYVEIPALACHDVGTYSMECSSGGGLASFISMAHCRNHPRPHFGDASRIEQTARAILERRTALSGFFMQPLDRRLSEIGACKTARRTHYRRHAAQR